MILTSYLQKQEKKRKNNNKNRNKNKYRKNLKQKISKKVTNIPKGKVNLLNIKKGKKKRTLKAYSGKKKYSSKRRK